jgi:hypothetical protein
MAKKGTLTANDAIRQALSEGLQTPDAIQVHLRKQGLDMDQAAISYLKGRIQAEEKKPTQPRSPAPQEKETESMAEVIPIESGRLRKAAPEQSQLAAPRPKAPRVSRQEKTVTQVSAQSVEPLPAKPRHKKSEEKALAPKSKPKKGRSMAVQKSLRSEQQGAPSLDDLFAVKSLVKEKGGSLSRLVQQVAEVEELASRFGSLGRLKQCLEVLKQLAVD